MPLGYLISAEEKWREDMAKAMRDDYDDDQMFSELFELQKGVVEPLEAVDCGRGYMFLLSYLLEDGGLDAVLAGEDFVVTYDDGTTITSNSAGIVAQLAKKLEAVDSARLETFAESYHVQVPRPEKNENAVEPSLLSLFDQVKELYSTAAKENKAVFCMVSL